MSPITLGFLAASGGEDDDYELIATAYGTGSSGVITFSSIPQSYAHLQIRGVSRTTDTSSLGVLDILGRYNGITTTDQTIQDMRAIGTTASAVRTASLAYQYLGKTNNSFTTNFPDGVHSATLTEINDYTSTTGNHRMTRFVSGVYGSSTGRGLFYGVSSLNTHPAITSIELTSPAGNWTTTTSFSLYGLRR